MGIELGHIRAIFRYPIKSMAGERLDSAKIGWHGVEGGRRKRSEMMIAFTPSFPRSAFLLVPKLRLGNAFREALLR